MNIFVNSRRVRIAELMFEKKGKFLHYLRKKAANLKIKRPTMTLKSCMNLHVCYLFDVF